MKKLLVDNRFPEKFSTEVTALGYEVLRLPPFDSLSPVVASHPDMLVYPLPSGVLVHYDYYVANKSLLDGLEKNIITTNERISAEYPDDILLNALNLNGVVYGRLDGISEYILSAASETVDVRQGYARCSVCVITPRAIITSDKSITAAASLRGIEVLNISPGHIALDGYSYGFIGGASCVLKLSDKDISICFFGNIKDHPDYQNIKAFAEKHNVKIISLSDAPLYDYGGAVTIE